METLRGLGNVRVTKGFLLDKLTVNRKSHKDLYDKAMKGWHLKVVKALEKECKKVEADAAYQPSVFVQKPISYTKNYDRTIDLLEASLDKEFVLTTKEFSQYVRDEWDWKEGFMTTVSGCLGV